MSISVKALEEQRAALVRTIQEFVEYREENDRDAEVLSGLVAVIDELLDTAPDRFAWQVTVDTDYHDGVNGGVVYDAPFHGSGEELEEHVVHVVKRFLIGADDDEGTAISTVISVRRVEK
jgi:hypothetical protein